MERLVKGDQVVVVVGKDRGKTGEIVGRGQDGKFVVQGINLAKNMLNQIQHKVRLVVFLIKKCRLRVLT